MPVLEFVQDYLDAAQEIEEANKQFEFQMKQAQKQSKRR